jgi:hypothetical protein
MVAVGSFGAALLFVSVATQHDPKLGSIPCFVGK